MKKLLLVIMLSLAATPAFATDYVFILKAISNPYWQALKQGIEETAAANKLDMKILTPVNDQAKEEHLNLCQTAISMQPKIIVMGAATTAIGIECFKLATAKGIIVADVDATVTPEQAQTAGVDLAFTIGADNIRIGEMAAEFITTRSSKPNPKVLLLEGVVGSPPSDDRIKGFKTQIKIWQPETEIVNSVSAEWDRLRGMTITADTLTRTPDLDVVFAANDVMAVGAVEALRNAGKNIMVVGVDGTPDAVKAIKAGRMTGSITQLPYLIGKRAMEKAVDVVNGKSTLQIERAKLLVLTKELLEENENPLLHYVR